MVDALWLVQVFLASGALAQLPLSLVSHDHVQPPIAPSVTNQKCRQDVNLYLQHLKNHTLWAVKMFDASAKGPVGLLEGSTYQMGHFDECLQVGFEEAPTEVVPLPAPIRGKYCLARIQLSPMANKYPDFTRQNVAYSFRLKYDPRGSAWEQIKSPSDPSKKHRDEFHWAVCVPASCGTKDVRDGLQSVLEPLAREQGVLINVEVDDNLCQTAEQEPYTTGQLTFIISAVVVVILVLGCTVFDMVIYRQRTKEEGQMPTPCEKIVVSMSAYSNLEKLNKRDSNQDLAPLHGLRLLSMVLIILGHRCLFTFGGPVFNPEFLEQRYDSIQDVGLVMNGILYVDTFFVISGFLGTCGLLYGLHKYKEALSFPMIYLYRFLRLTPTYMVVVAFYATFFIKVDKGPLWKARVGLERDRCADNWWTNLLYINNYVNTDRMCMFQSWYLTCDTHYFILAPLLIVPLYRKPILGVIALISTLVISIIIPFVIVYIGHYNGVLRLYFSLLEDPIAHRDFNELYVKSHVRATPYIIGIAAAFVYSVFKIKNIKIPPGWTLILFCISTVVALCSLFGAYFFYLPHHENSPLEHAAYASLHRLGWAVAMGYVIVGACSSGFNVLQPIFTLRAFLPLSRLTYSAFLVHGAIQLYTGGTIRQPEYVSVMKVIMMACGDIVISFIFALFLHLLVEAPLGGLQKLVIKQHKTCKTEDKKPPLDNLEPQEEIRNRFTEA